MYNTELKTRFIRHYTQSIHTATNAENIFNTMEPYEEAWGSDLCTRSTKELQDVLDNVLSLRNKSQVTQMVILREYAKWCLANRVPGASDGMLHVEYAGSAKIRKQMVSGPLHLQKQLDTLFDPPEKETIDVIYRCYFWMAFSGLDEKDAMSIRETDVDFRKMEIVYQKSHYPIYREAIPAFKKACTLRDFCYEHPLYNNPIRRNRTGGDLLIRGIKPTTVTAIRTVMTRYTTATEDCRLSFKRMWLSGLFFRVYERERAGIPPDFSEAALKFVAEKDYKLNGATLRSIQNKEAKYYMNDYQRWKLAFSV